jgi:riboflavin kinase/FMN adenylyltransferase
VEIITDPDGITSLNGSHAVTIGAYDGVHRGHLSVIRQTQTIAARLDAKAAVVTFEPHPAQVLRPENAPALLTALDHKLELLDQAGVETVVVVPFDRARATETPEEFVQTILVNCLQARAVVVGADFHFGANRSGNVEVLAGLGKEHGFDVEGIDLLRRTDGKIESVSSTAVRRALAGGEIRTANGMLGHPHELRGTVVKGDQRGSTIGFPTANVAVRPEMAMPADAVYAAWYLRPDGIRRAAAVNVGKRPTFYQDAEHSLVEAHVIDFDGDLYGELGRVEFVELIRSEQRFDGIDALRAQLELDVERARTILEREPS